VFPVVLSCLRQWLDAATLSAGNEAVRLIQVGSILGQSADFFLIRKCNGPNGLSSDLTPIPNLESYRWTIYHPFRGKKQPRHVPGDPAASILPI